ncbi:universal stress protein [Phenylobacterium sp.]|uniref:universal stress protein n=1 Tax=Phenylobacterium sp. TaxID=1871053 RepID=UPI0027312652|nr:universal stress protein [Phenylobacterium sp.]MDP2214078.1 universal stress protein [Phenylobacterium sp.]
MKKILCAIDASTYGPSLCDHAAWFALRSGASVDVLHVLDRAETGSGPRLDLSGSVGLGASEALLEKLTQADEARGQAAQAHGRAMLEGARARLQAAGVAEVNLVHRHGEVAETLIELEKDADLVIIGKRGESHNFAEGHLGAKVERVVRGSSRPILVAPRVFMPITRVMVAYDGGASATKALDHVLGNPVFADIEVVVAIIGDPGAQRDGRVANAEARLAGRAQASVRALEGDVETVLKGALRKGEGDLLVMGAYGHSRIRELIVGSTTTAMIRTGKVPVLLFR